MSKKTTNKNTVGEGRNMRIKEHHLILTKRNIKHVNNWKTLVIIIWTCRTVFKLLWFYTVTSQTSNDPNSGCLELLHDFFLRMIPWNTDSWSYQWAKYGRLGFSGNKTLRSHSIAQVTDLWRKYLDLFESIFPPKKITDTDCWRFLKSAVLKHVINVGYNSYIVWFLFMDFLWCKWSHYMITPNFDMTII